MSGKNETKFWKLIKQRTPEIRWNRIENAINSTEFNKPICPIFQNVCAQAVVDPKEIKQNLV